MSDITSYYNSASLTHQIQENTGLLADVNEDVLFFKDDVSMRFAQLQIENYPYWHPDMPTDIRDSEIWKDLIRYNKTPHAQEMIRKGNLSELSAMAGFGKQGDDATGLEKLENELKQPGKIIYLFAKMNAGKTFFATLNSQIFYDYTQRKYGEDLPSQEVLASNNESLEGMENVNNIPKLLEWLKRSDKDKLFVFDEASLYANSFSGNMANTYSTLLPLTIIIRRYGGRILYIGHSGTDLGNQLRKMATIIKKDSKKKATVYGSIDDNGKPQDKKFALYAIPEMIKGAEEEGLIPSTEAKGSWNWQEGDQELIEDELSGELEDYVDDLDECEADECEVNIGLDEDGFCASHR